MLSNHGAHYNHYAALVASDYILSDLRLGVHDLPRAWDKILIQSIWGKE